MSALFDVQAHGCSCHQVERATTIGCSLSKAVSVAITFTAVPALMAKLGWKGTSSDQPGPALTTPPSLAGSPDHSPTVTCSEGFQSDALSVTALRSSRKA